MKTLNNFFEKAHLFKVWLVIYLILIFFISSLFYGLDYISGERTFTDNLNYLKLGVLMGMVFSWLIVNMTSMSRKSTIFWNYAEYFEELVYKTNTKEGLEKIWYNEFNELVNKCLGGNQIGEVRRLKTMIQTKYNCIKE